jgi:hypothetical protein
MLLFLNYYLLFDGIYLKWLIFVKLFMNHKEKKWKWFAQQEV